MKSVGLLAAVWLLAASFGGCGYSLSPTPYGLLEPLTVSVPLAANNSPYGELGPMLTQDVITRLDTSSSIYVRENGSARLKMTITRVYISGGAWQPERNHDLPTTSASRVASLTVEAVLERPDPAGGPPLVRRQVFSSQRTFLVGGARAQTDLRQQEAFQWLANDLGQKISQTMFSEF